MGSSSKNTSTAEGATAAGMDLEQDDSDDEALLDDMDDDDDPVQKLEDAADELLGSMKNFVRTGDLNKKRSLDDDDDDERDRSW
ncbi:hypothetical protein SEMRO_1505_G278230.1 [Seminavis robusta]|uniref:Uncharacterized protein n=1 Tax=Seminavis robusta TaxID=568900 RepID=A0A9N8ERJ3_9STRA|nr:hypothetical protein SEMRO_1505_G278230.1 [Seminavis robusta]|eukprot:Sro1505_g278230.1 n/a (84) ;mRNA; r:19840-20091